MLILVVFKNISYIVLSLTQMQTLTHERMQKKSVLLCLFSVTVFAFSCVKDSREVSEPVVPLADDISIAKAFFDSEIGRVSLPDRARLGGASATRGIGGAEGLTAASTPDWGVATTYRDGEIDVVQVPLEQSDPVTALVRLTDSLGNTVYSKKRVVTWLLLSTDAEGHRRTMTATVIPGKHYRVPQAVDPEVATMYTTHDLRGTDFTGTVLYATVEGRLILGGIYDNGQIVSYLTLSSMPPPPMNCMDEGSAHASDTHSTDTEDNHPGKGHANGHANGNNGNAYGHDKPNSGQGHAYGRMRQIATATIELVDEEAATPGYVLSWEGGWDDPWDGGDMDDIIVTACGCGHCSGGCYCIPCPPPYCVWCNSYGCYGECLRDQDPDPDPDPYDPIDDDPGNGDDGGTQPPPGLPTNIDVPAELRSILEMLQAAGLNLDGVRIVFNNGRATARAWIDNGQIKIDSDEFYTFPLSDQKALLAHEVTHLKNDLPVSQDHIRIEPPRPLGDPPAEVRDWIIQGLMRDFPLWDSFSPDIRESVYSERFVLFELLDRNWYINEINAIETEKQLCPEVSYEYEMDREYKLWKWKRILEIYY